MVLAGNVTSTSFLLTWCHSPEESTSTPYTAYVLEYWETDSSSPPCSISLAGQVKEHTVTGLKPQTKYSVKMAAENAAGRGPFCEPLLVQTESDGEYLLITVCMVLGELFIIRFNTESITADFSMFWPQAFSAACKTVLYATFIEQCTNDRASMNFCMMMHNICTCHTVIWLLTNECKGNLACTNLT